MCSARIRITDNQAITSRPVEGKKKENKNTTIEIKIEEKLVGERLLDLDKVVNLEKTTRAKTGRKSEKENIDLSGTRKLEIVGNINRKSEKGEIFILNKIAKEPEVKEPIRSHFIVRKGIAKSIKSNGPKG